MQLQAEADHVGKYVRCPGCNTKLQIPQVASTNTTANNLPAPSSLPAPAAAPGGMKLHMPKGSAPAPNIPGPSAPPPSYSAPSESYDAPQEESVEEHRNQRGGWEEKDPTNPHGVLSFGIGFAVAAAWLAFIYLFKAPDSLPHDQYNTMQFIASLFYKHMEVAFINTLFFTWAMSILVMKYRMLQRQRRALLLNVLPWEMGAEINADNVGNFIDHLYKLPRRLRDSMMVNRIRKALELFEVKQNNGAVVNMLGSQSDIDSMRIGGSYALLKAFLWAIPILGFIGTVIGLSHAIAGMAFENVDDVAAVMASLQKVTGGLGTAFDATLLGLAFALMLNFPLNTMMKDEDDTLNDIDAFCNEILLPRLNDGSGIAAGDPTGMMDVLVKAVASSQQEFLGDLNALTAQIKTQADHLDRRAEAHQQRVTQEFSDLMVQMRADLTKNVLESVKLTTDYTKALAEGINNLNDVLKELNGKQVVVQKKKGWFGR